MQKLAVLSFAFISLVTLSCGSKKKTTAQETAAVKEVAKTKIISYVNDVAPLLKPSCSPCHYPSLGGNKVALDSYTAFKSEVASALIRVKLPKDGRGYMPFQNKKPALSDSAIAVIEAWQKSGMVE